MAKNIWFGMHVPPEGRNFEEMKKICLAVEDAGFDLFTMTDHFMNMRNPGGVGVHPLESWTTLGALAVVTSKIKLGTLVTCYAYRRPTVLAKMATTVDIISGGRLVFGVGAGWHVEEFNGFMGGFPPAKERLRGLRETVEICKSMFANEHTTYHGRMYQVHDVLNSPQPVQKRIPIMVGGSGEQVTLRIAAKYADISHMFAADRKELEHKFTVLRGHCEALGRDYDSIRKATSLSLEKLDSASDVEKAVNTINEYREAGAGLITFRYPGLESLKLFKDKIIPQF